MASRIVAAQFNEARLEIEEVWTRCGPVST